MGKSERIYGYIIHCLQLQLIPTCRINSLRRKERAHLLFVHSNLFSTENPEFCSKFSINQPQIKTNYYQATTLSIMDTQKQIMGLRFLVVDFDKSWDLILGQAQVKSCQVGHLWFHNFTCCVFLYISVLYFHYVCISLFYIFIMDISVLYSFFYI